METTKANASVILEQLGGKRFLTMTGAKNLVNMGDGLKMKIPRNKSKGTYLYIQLLVNDTYRMTFASIRKYKWIVRKEINNVYSSDLVNFFESETGLYTTL
ncbi:MAG: hypothetical protein KAT68_19550 [Bacteroidales bacterium]|nr:hypothetical protein [Bacteroidales bacterium]